MNRYALAVFVGLVIVCNSGCGKPARRVAPPLRSVKGMVNLDGKPMADGEIWFDRYGEPLKIWLFRQMRVVFLKRWTCFPFMELQQHTP
jgi:hypothetical protein